MSMKTKFQYSSLGRAERDKMDRRALLIRQNIIKTLHKGGGGHFGGCLSVVEILAVLLQYYLVPLGKVYSDDERNRLILSKGHAALALYASLDAFGLLPISLDTYGIDDTLLTSHPDMTGLSEIDFSSGSLGQGLSVALGMAIAKPRKIVFAVLGDGECQEGQIWEAAMLASRLRTENLVGIVDSNAFQECGYRYANEPSAARPVQDLRRKWEAFGWTVFECDGHDVFQLHESLHHCCTNTGGPSILLANTIKGKGVQTIERDPYRFHCTSTSDAEFVTLMDELR